MALTGGEAPGGFITPIFSSTRFLNLFGGFTEKTDSYSFAAGTVIMPYVVGSSDCVVGRSTSWASMVGNTQLLVMFGGLPLKNTQVEYGASAATHRRAGCGGSRSRYCVRQHRPRRR
ncbi:MAG: hypothetical protein WDO24_10045 [Pseudomonadota bacterium]